MIRKTYTIIAVRRVARVFFFFFSKRKVHALVWEVLLIMSVSLSKMTLLPFGPDLDDLRNL